mmetsp:Transcript_42517/g.70958  ORF Transcript_42517/g.70958 Transcript_42517/m.70958 type:complete len:183 (-) Transcript_42517:112-660(-)|eukprot:CAMPEP_0198231706 /NCGR_PEP_ID=MMETSP1445-20131203/115342_1 /TAXON_ID=36898 /ORGANISM="Pyramimonas sp., Strain CCMP2087" /LENGTH=182 /DNA_ID=CAMNT_0043912333 /DNA_START=96 /DNA_END=644 /DNA_ORIENTATION=-
MAAIAQNVIAVSARVASGSRSEAPVAKAVLPARQSAFAGRSRVVLATRSRAQPLQASKIVATMAPSMETAEVPDEIPVPKGMKRYETMFLMLPDASEEELAKEIAKVEGMIKAAGAAHVDTLNRGRQPLAYNIKGFPEAVYVQMNYIAPSNAAPGLEREIAKPTLGDRKLIMRFMTHNYGAH